MRDSWAFAEMRERLFIASRATFGHTVLHAIPFLMLLGVVEAVGSADKVASDASNTLELYALANFHITHSYHLLFRSGHGTCPAACLT